MPELPFAGPATRLAPDAGLKERNMGRDICSQALSQARTPACVRPASLQDADGQLGLQEVGSIAELLRLGRQLTHPTILNVSLDRAELAEIARYAGRGIDASRTFGQIREIRHNPNNPYSIAGSVGEQPLHTDGTFMETPPSAFILYFRKTDPSGGASTLLPLHDILQRLPAAFQNALSTAVVQFARDNHRGFSDAWQGSLLALDAAGRITIRWRDDAQVGPKVVDTRGTPIAEAIERVRHIISELSPTVYQAKPNDLLMIPNQTFLHGRTRLSQGSSWTVYRIWIQ